MSDYRPPRRPRGALALTALGVYALLLVVVLPLDDSTRDSYLAGRLLAPVLLAWLLVALIAGTATRTWPAWLGPVALAATAVVLAAGLHGLQALRSTAGADDEFAADAEVHRVTAPPSFGQWHRDRRGIDQSQVDTAVDELGRGLARQGDVVGDVYAGPEGRVVYIGLNIEEGSPILADLHRDPEATLRAYLGEMQVTGVTLQDAGDLGGVLACGSSPAVAGAPAVTCGWLDEGTAGTVTFAATNPVRDARPPRCRDGPGRLSGGRARLHLVEPSEPTSIVPGDRPGTFVLRMAGMNQSHVDLRHPLHLEFEYVRRIADVIDAAGPPGAPLRVLHVGGAAMTLPRYVAAARPRSAQVVLEPAGDVTELVRAELPLPPRSGIKVRPVDGRRGVAELRDGYAELVVLDAFADARVPGELVTVEFFRDVARVLEPAGLFVLNLTDRAPFGWTRRVVGGLRSVFPELMLTAEPATLRARRLGNLVVVASRGPVPVAALRQRSASAPAPYRVLDAAQVSDGFGGGTPFTTIDTEPSPPPVDR